MTQAAGRGSGSRRPGSPSARSRQEASEDVPKGRVIAQDPDAAEHARPPGGAVDLDRLDRQARRRGALRDRGGQGHRARRSSPTRACKVKLVRGSSDEDQGHGDRHGPATPADSVSTGSLVTVFYSAGPQEGAAAWSGSRGARPAARLRRPASTSDTVHDSTTTVARRAPCSSRARTAFTDPAAGHTVVDHRVDLRSRRPRPSPTGTPSEPRSPASRRAAAPRRSRHRRPAAGRGSARGCPVPAAPGRAGWAYSQVGRAVVARASCSRPGRPRRPSRGPWRTSCQVERDVGARGRPRRASRRSARSRRSGTAASRARRAAPRCCRRT